MADNEFVKDPEAVLDYAFEWDKWLEKSDQPETITAHEITTPKELNVDRSTEAGGIVSVWLSGGLGGKTYRVECKITTSKGRVDERSIWVKVKER